LRPGRFAAAVDLRPVGILVGFLPAAFFRAADFVERDFAAAALLAFFFGPAAGLFAVGLALVAAAEGPDAMGVVTFAAPFLALTTDAATAIRRAYFFFIAILVDMLGSCFPWARRVMKLAAR
jgi:hypothetical protein